MSVVRRPGKLATACGQESVWTESGEEAARADGQKSADLAGAGSHPAMLQGFVPSGNSKNITYMTAKLVADVIRDVTGISVRVRPVNDLYVGEKKVGGILTEAGSDFDTGELQWLVIGIGINVSTPADAFPAEIRERAGSLYPDGHALVTRNELVAAIISRLLEA